MRNRRIYGESKISTCPFCSRAAYEKNKQKIPVCKNHKNMLIREDLKCLCGQYLELTEGKFGPYFKCITCGNINFDKALEMNGLTQDTLGVESSKKEKKSYSSSRNRDEKNALMHEFMRKMKK